MICNKCKVDKPIEDFSESNIKHRIYTCRLCKNAMKRFYTAKKYEGVTLDGIIKACENNEVPVTSAKNMWLKNSKQESVFVVNPLFETTGLDLDSIDFEAIIGNVNPILTDRTGCENSALFDRLVFSDTHIGMDCTDSLYDLEWNESILFNRLEIMVKHCVSHQKSDILYINDLGDLADGYEGSTTRGGHSLKQNMDSQTQFDVAVRFKITLIESLLKYYKEIKFINICNDNHGGAFAYIINSSVKTYCEKVYKGVEVINQKKFIDSYKVGNYIFILTHGKDSKELKFGMPAKASEKTINYLTSYINEKRLLNPDYAIELSKGDSHQYLFDNSSSDHFSYCNYPAFSNSSNWVQHNFKKGRSGFIHFNYRETGKSINEHFFI